MSVINIVVVPGLPLKYSCKIFVCFFKLTIGKVTPGNGPQYMWIPGIQVLNFKIVLQGSGVIAQFQMTESDQ